MIKTENINGIFISSFEGINKLNALNSESVKEELKAIYKVPDVRLILDLKAISFIDSSGFGVFLSLLKTANSNSGHFRLCNLCKEVMELFKLLQLHNVFEIYNSREDALNSFDS